MNTIKLSHGPILTYVDSDGDTHDVTKRAHEFLSESMETDGDVTLGDYLALLGTSPILQAVYRRDFAESIFEEAQKGPLVQKDEDHIEYLELYCHWYFDSSTKTYSDLNRLSLHGIGAVLTEDQEGYKAGQRIAWGITGCPVRELLPVPVRVSLEVPVLESDPDAHATGKEIQRVHIDAVTFGQVLHGLLWELSFYGSPSEAKATWDEIKEDLEDAKAGRDCASHVTTGSIFKDLGLPIPAGIAVMFDTIGKQDPWNLEFWLREIPDEENAAESLDAEYEGEVVVRPEYRTLTGYQFRRTFRLAEDAAMAEHGVQPKNDH
jgi:hypothetical protein